MNSPAHTPSKVGMTHDTMALLHVSNLTLRAEYAAKHTVELRDDCALLSLAYPFSADIPEAHRDFLALNIRQAIGRELDRHDDARGVLLFSKTRAPQSTTYEALVQEIGGDGIWVQKPLLPPEYVNPPPGTYEELVAQLIARVGYVEAMNLDAAAERQRVDVEAGRTTESSKAYRDAIEAVLDVMGDTFTKRYEAMLAAQVSARMSAARKDQALAKRITDRLERGEPLVSSQEMMNAFRDERTAEAIAKAVSPELAEQLEAMDVEHLPEDDLARLLKGAIKKKP